MKHCRILIIAVFVLASCGEATRERSLQDHKALQKEVFQLAEDNGMVSYKLAVVRWALRDTVDFDEKYVDSLYLTINPKKK